MAETTTRDSFKGPELHDEASTRRSYAFNDDSHIGSNHLGGVAVLWGVGDEPIRPGC